MTLKKVIFPLMFLFVIILMPLVSASVSISEVMYNLEGADEDHEWIEIKNAGEIEINLDGWKFYEDETNHRLNSIQGSMVLQSGSYAIIADNAQQFLIDYPEFNGNLFDSSFSLSNTGESIALKNKEGEIVSEIVYTDSWGADGNGNSLQLCDDSWNEKTSTPGTTNDCGVETYCGDETCDADETCDNCAADCLSEGQVCCGDIAYAGDCCINSDCPEDYVCENYACVLSEEETNLENELQDESENDVSEIDENSKEIEEEEEKEVSVEESKEEQENEAEEQDTEKESKKIGITGEAIKSTVGKEEDKEGEEITKSAFESKSEKIKKSAIYIFAIVLLGAVIHIIIKDKA